MAPPSPGPHRRSAIMRSTRVRRAAATGRCTVRMSCHPHPCHRGPSWHPRCPTPASPVRYAIMDAAADISEGLMPSPFPGMDPFLQGYLWPDVYTALANKIRQILAPRLRPRYVVRIEIYVVEDTAPESEIGIMYPDVEVMLSRPAVSPAPADRSNLAVSTSATPAALTIPVLDPIDVRVPTIEIHDVARNQLVTCIEILSPVNKREPGLPIYRQKRQRLYHAGVHLLEIDLLRRGSRPLAHPRVPETAYLIALTRAHSGSTAIWPLTLRDSLPDVPIPLHPPDGDRVLELGAALAAIYDEAGYDLSIDYQAQPPPPPLSADDALWVRTL